jgi:C1A family cysteine protease
MPDQKLKRRIAGMGWRPDTPDQRDLSFAPALLGAKKPSILPSQVDLRPGCPPVYDQGNLGSCTANAIAGAIEFDQLKQKLPEFTPSRLFIYYNERVIEGSVREDAGAEIRDGIKSLSKQGAPDEKEWPYVETKFARKPGKRIYADAAKHLALQYARVSQTQKGLCECLASGFPVIFGFTCYESFESDEVAKSGELNLPDSSEQVVGGHAVLCVGYDMTSKRFIVRNSWNTDWGIKGYFTMPFDYLLDHNLADDLWALRQVQ